MGKPTGKDSSTPTRYSLLLLIVGKIIIFIFLKNLLERKMKLSKDPVLQNQPCKDSCAMTCIAMALDLPVKELLEDYEESGFDISLGLTSRKVSYVLSRFKIGSMEFLNTGVFGLVDGVYFGDVPSKNRTGLSHCVLLFINDGEVLLLDPNNGKKDVKFYETDEFNTAPFYSFTKLDDFSDLVKGDFKK